MSQNATQNYQQIRKALLHRGTNLRRWARAHGFKEQSVYHAARGTRNGVLSYTIRRSITRYINE